MHQPQGRRGTPALQNEKRPDAPLNCRGCMDGEAMAGTKVLQGSRARTSGQPTTGKVRRSLSGPELQRQRRAAAGRRYTDEHAG